MLKSLFDLFKKASQPPPLRQCVQCGALEGTLFCDRYICKMVEIRPCERCNKRQLCYGDVNGECPLANRIRANKRGCKDAIQSR